VAFALVGRGCRRADGRCAVRRGLALELPSRHTQREMQQGVLRSAEVLARAQATTRQKTPARWRALGALLPAAILLIVAARDRAAARAADARVPFDRTQLVSADLAGLRVSPEDLAPGDAPLSPSAGLGQPPGLVAGPEPEFCVNGVLIPCGARQPWNSRLPANCHSCRRFHCERSPSMCPGRHRSQSSV